MMSFKGNMKAKEVENLCNVFASELLLPSSVFLSRIGVKRHDISLVELSDIKKQYGISIDTIMDSMRRHNVITGRCYEGYLKKKRSFPDFNAVVEQSMAIPKTTGRFARMVYRALADEIISFSKAAALLNTSIETVKHQLILI